MKAEKISELTTNRLSIYLRCLLELRSEGQSTVSSAALAKRFHLNSAQIRKDLAYFGEFGIRGVGYYVDTLIDNLRTILGLDHDHNVCIIGSGRLGTALADYNGFRKSNFSVKALFDADAKKIGKKVGGAEIFDIKNFQSVVKRNNIDIAVIAVPADSAERVLELVAKAGIKAVMNFAPVPLKASDRLKVRTVDLTTCLESLSFFLAGTESINGSGLKPKRNTRRKR